MGGVDQARWPLWLVGLLAVAGATLGVGIARPAAAATTPVAVSASFLPNSLAIAPGRTRRAVLRSSNNTNAPVVILHVDFTVDPGIRVKPISFPARLAAHRSKTVQVAVTRTTDAPATSSVEAVVKTRKGG